MPSPLCAICDAEACVRAGWTAVDFAAACLDGGACFLQVRAKRLPAGPFLDLVDAIVRAGRVYGAAVIVNDRVDVARLAEAAGVHVGQDDLPPRAARDQLGRDAIIGASTHTEAQVRAALDEPLEYLAVGPVFGTATKETGYDAVGLSLVSRVRRIFPPRTPLVAIGGITIDRAPAVIAAGASAVAVISDLLTTGDPSARVRAYLERLREGGNV